MNKTVPQVIEEWLIKEDRTQIHLARKAGLAQGTLTRVMTGKQRPGPRVLRRLELAMGLPTGTLQSLQAQPEASHAD